jgi:hypothetical protein
MSDVINPEAALPTTTQGFEQSGRNPSVTTWGDGGGGQILTPSSSEGRMTQAGAGPSQNAGLTNYDTGDSADGVQDEAEREG